MFNKQEDNETDFCESYKSQILGSTDEEMESSTFTTVVKLLTIVILLVTIIAVSFYGYNYFQNNKNLKNKNLPPISMQVSEEETISDDDLVVELAEPEIEKVMLIQVEDNESISNEVLVEEVLIEIEEPKIEKIIKKENISLPLVVSPQIEEIEIERISNDIETILEKNEIKEEDESKMEEKIHLLPVLTSQVEEVDIETIANDVKIAIAKSEMKEENESTIEEKMIEELRNISKSNIVTELNSTKIEESLEVPTSAPEAQYLEELADLSKEIDKERNK